MISIIIPIFNSEKTLSRCLDSILLQTYRDIEIICVDDGSSDGSFEILQEYKKKDSRIVCIKQTNGGVSSARNAGLSIANGLWVGFIDPDDYIDRRMFEELIALMKDDIDLSGCGTSLEYEAWGELKKRDQSYFQVNLGIDVRIQPGLLKEINGSVCNKLFRNEIIKKNDLKFPVGTWYEDAYFTWCYLTVSRKMSFTSEKLYHYVRYSDSIMGATFRKSARALDHFRISIFAYEFLRKTENYSKYLDDLLYFTARNALFSLYYLPLSKKHHVLLESHGLFKRYSVVEHVKILFFMLIVFLRKIFNKVKI